MILTMSIESHRWSVAAAKAELSRVLTLAPRHPQVIERRGKAVAVVIAIDQFEDETAGARWRKFIELSAELRADGGAELRLPRRERRASPLQRV
jgi:hypothetical protein